LGLIFLLAALAVIALASGIKATPAEKKAFNAYLKKHHLHLKGAAYNKRLQIFVKNLRHIKAHNNDPHVQLGEDGPHLHITDEEFAKWRLGARPPHDHKRSLVEVADAEAIEGLPKSINWVTRHKVTKVKDQGNCGSCWAFASAAALESAWAIKTGHLTDLSTQQITSCTGGGSQGCNGGWPADAYNDILTRGGIRSWKSYPYRAKTGTCVAGTGPWAAHVAAPASFVIPPGKQSLMNYVGTKGPATVCIDVVANDNAKVETAAKVWQYYKGGVIRHKACPHTQCNHEVTVVGYGFLKNIPVWIIKNSWGTSWGAKGYGYLERDNTAAGTCGIHLLGVAPVV